MLCLKSKYRSVFNTCPFSMNNKCPLSSFTKKKKKEKIFDRNYFSQISFMHLSIYEEWQYWKYFWSQTQYTKTSHNYDPKFTCNKGPFLKNCTYPEHLLQTNSSMTDINYLPSTVLGLKQDLGGWAQLALTQKSNAGFRLACRSPLCRVIIACCFRVAALSGFITEWHRSQVE